MINNFFKLSLFCLITNCLAISSPSILITGGAGYIGSATVLLLLKKGYSIIVIDKKLPTSKFYNNSPKVSNLEQLKKIPFLRSTNNARNVTFIKADFANTKILNYLFSKCNINTVIHFAGFIEVGRSIKDPELFYKNNVNKTFTLLEVMRRNNINNIIFSSSAAVYGLPKTKMLLETHEEKPINPYGKTKYIVDMILEDYVHAYNFKAISLRYFNAAGALPLYDIGERHNPETHVIPLLLKAAYTKKPFYLFGDNYQTPDKSCIRDYLHIYDIAKAHYLALQHIEKNIDYDVFNLGTGKGYSVKELISCAEKITGIQINVQVAQRRPGDPDRLIADSSKAQSILGWFPTESSLENILLTAHHYMSQK